MAKEEQPVLEEETVEEELPELPEEAEVEEIVVEEDPVQALSEQIANLQKQLEESNTQRLRAYADMDNTRKRLQKEADLTKQYRFQGAAEKLLPVLDNLETALKHVPENEEAQNFAKGFELILKQLQDVMSSEGVTEIEALGKPFDANFMQALAKEPAEDTESDTVIEVYQKGYKIKDRLLRAALVKVSE